LDHNIYLHKDLRTLLEIHILRTLALALAMALALLLAMALALP
jgi:hypothetical protein